MNIIHHEKFIHPIFIIKKWKIFFKLFQTLFLFFNFFQIDFKTISKLFPNSSSFLLFLHRSNSWLLSWLRGFHGNAKEYKSLINSFIEFNTVEGYTSSPLIANTTHIQQFVRVRWDIPRSRNLSVWQNDNSTVCPIVEGRRFDAILSIRFYSIYMYIYFFFPSS